MFFMLLLTTNAQNSSDSLSLTKDSLLSLDPIESKIISYAEDSIDYDLINNKVYMYHNASVKYYDITLEAAYIELNSKDNTVFAKSLKDSLGNNYGYPSFIDKGKSFSSKEMTYNFKSKKGIIKEVITQEGEAYVHGKKVKKNENDVIFTQNGKYTTCDHEVPHFSIWSNKIKTIPSKKIITGPAVLEFSGVPTPLAIPFGFFPNQKKQSSGLIFPIYGESANRGFFLRYGGYYFAISDYLDLAIKADIYSKGSWGINAHSNYIKRYKYSGDFNISYASLKSGNKLIGNNIDQRDFFVRWSHKQDPKASNNSRFSANINAGSSSYHKNNSFSDNDYLTNTFKSSISYSKTFSKSSISTNLNHSQNTKTKIVSLSLPTVSYNLNTLYPFKFLNKTNKSKWYDKISFKYNADAKNTISTTDSLLFKEKSLDQFRNGIKHSSSIKTSFKSLKYFTLSPSFNYSERWYQNSIEKQWLNEQLITDTVAGFERAFDYNFSLSMKTKIYGILKFKKSKIKAIRHVMTPSASVSYNPDFSKSQFGFYKNVQIDSLGNTQDYSIFQNGIYGSPSGSESGRVNFGLSNILEMKVKTKNDTAETTKKVKLLEAFNFNTSYNLLADSLNLSIINLSGRTKLFNKFDITFNGSYDPYIKNEEGVRINKFYFDDNYVLGRLTNSSASLNFRLKGGENDEDDELASHWLDYIDFDIPWSLSVNYTIDYKKDVLIENYTQSVNFSGDLKLTENWKIAFNSGYDFKGQELTYTSLDIYRDLHCWEMKFKWIPFGNHQSYNFSIRVKASVLQDLKWEKKKDWYDY